MGIGRIVRVTIEHLTIAPEARSSATTTSPHRAMPWPARTASMVCFLRRSSAQSGILVSPGPVTDAISNTIPIGRRWIIGEPVKMDQRTSAKIVAPWIAFLASSFGLHPDKLIAESLVGRVARCQPGAANGQIRVASMDPFGRPLGSAAGVCGCLAVWLSRFSSTDQSSCGNIRPKNETRSATCCGVR